MSAFEIRKAANLYGLKYKELRTRMEYRIDSMRETPEVALRLAIQNLTNNFGLTDAEISDYQKVHSPVREVCRP